MCKPDYDLDLMVFSSKVCKTIQVVPSLLDRGFWNRDLASWGGRRERYGPTKQTGKSWVSLEAGARRGGVKAAVERIWHTKGSQAHILAMAFR